MERDAVELAAATAVEQVHQAMVVRANEDGHARSPCGHLDAPLHPVALGDGRGIEALQFPHEEENLPGILISGTAVFFTAKTP